MKTIISDMFLGLTNPKMGGVRFFIYQLLLTGIIFAMGKSIDAHEGDISFFAFISMIIALLMILFTTLNTTAKRFRDIGLSKPWLQTIAIPVAFFIYMRNIDNEYITYGIDFIFILIVSIIPKDFANKDHSTKSI